MKTNPSARWLMKARIVLVGATLAAVIGLELRIGESLVGRIGQTTTTEATQVPAIDISDLMSATH